MALDRKISIADITGPVNAANQGQKDSLLSALGITTALSNAREIANGDKGAFTVSSGTATLNGGAVMAALMTEAGLAPGDLVMVNDAGDGLEPAEVAAPSSTPVTASSTSGAVSLNFSTTDVVWTTTTENITSISVTGLELYDTGYWRVKNTTARDITWPGGWWTPAASHTGTSNAVVTFKITRTATNEYDVSVDSTKTMVALPISIVGFAQNKGGDPTMPTHSAGNLIVGGILRQGSTASVPSTGGWTEWVTYTATGCCVSLYYKVAASSAEAWGTWSSGGRRFVWVFDNAQLGHVNGSALATSSATTTLTWPALNGGAAFTGGQSIVCAAVLTANAQTSVTGHEPTGLSNVLLAAVNSTNADAEVIADTGTGFLTSYTGDTRTLDTSSTYATIVFSVAAA